MPFPHPSLSLSLITSTSLKISAHGISVCTPDQGSSSSAGGQGLLVPSYLTTGNPYEREHYFWVYTDFYKWSLISQGGKLALLLNVFADASFARRNEYIFRNKEAVRLASAIEYFIEKFMSVMHIRLETEAGAFDDLPGGMPETTTNNNNTNNKGSASSSAAAGLHQVNADEWLDDSDLLNDNGDGNGAGGVGEMVDLLDLNDDDDDHNNSNHNNNNNNNNLLLPPTPPSAPSSSSGGGVSSGLGLSSDPFSSADPFSSHPPAPASSLPVARALTPSQLAQHRAWGQVAMGNGGGPLYDDGTIQATMLTLTNQPTLSLLPRHSPLSLNEPTLVRHIFIPPASPPLLPSCSDCLSGGDPRVPGPRHPLLPQPLPLRLLPLALASRRARGSPRRPGGSTALPARAPLHPLPGLGATDGAGAAHGMHEARPPTALTATTIQCQSLCPLLFFFLPGTVGCGGSVAGLCRFLQRALAPQRTGL